jgi:chromate transporter
MNDAAWRRFAESTRRAALTPTPPPQTTMQASANNNPPQALSFGEALKFWLRLGFISFGGPAGQIAIMQRELVEGRRWVSQARFNHALNYCMLLPGPEAQQLATYIGWLLHGTRGGIAAGVLFVLPSLFILIALSALYVAYGQVPTVAALFWGVKAAVAVIVLQAIVRLTQRSILNRPLAGVFIAQAAISFIALQFFQVSFVVIVLAAGLFGWALARARPGLFAAAPKAVHGTAAAISHAPALIDDHSPAPAYTAYQPARLAKVLAAGAALWALPFVALLLTQGWSATLTQMAWFFSKAALVTFGGAYAVLPYVNQAAVEHYQWLTAAQMMDGLALGETTPGPLIMIVAFVGFLGGAQTSTGLAVAGACVATWFTFLPSFIFILAGGPWVETTRGNLKLTAPLAAISAAVVGVMFTLAIDFIAAYAMNTPANGQFDYQSLMLMLLAGVAAWRFKLGVISLIALSAAAGFAIKMVYA